MPGVLKANFPRKWLFILFLTFIIILIGIAGKSLIIVIISSIWGISCIVRVTLFKEIPMTLLLPSFKSSTIKIGNQIWMTKNLFENHFRNGDLIPYARTEDEWEKAGNEGMPAWCYYENKPENGMEYGKLYNWYAVNDPRGLAPEGWHVPNKRDFKTLLSNFNDDECEDGNDEGAYDTLIEGGSSKFSALMGGCCDDDAIFKYIDEKGYWWSSVKDSTNYATSLCVSSYNQNIEIGSHSKWMGLSVRCLRDKVCQETK